MNSNSKSPLYFNLSKVLNYEQQTNDSADINKSPSIIEIFNNAPFLNNANDYYVGVMRALIPISGIPRLIVPVLLGSVNGGAINTDPDLLLYKISLSYRNANGIIITAPCVSNVYFISEIRGIKPKMDGIKQDFITNKYYYFVYDVNTILLSLNQTILRIWNKFVSNCSDVGVDISGCVPPYYTFNPSNDRFTFNSDVRFFNQDDNIVYDPILQEWKPQPIARCEFYTDGLLQDLFQNPSTYYLESARQGFQNNIFLNNVSARGGNPVNGNIISMNAWKSSINMWNAFSKVLFTVNYGIPTKLEYENQQQNSGENRAVSLADDNFNIRPLKSTLTDFQVDVNDFALNDNYIQFSASSIAQIRLIDITTNQDLKDFSLTVSWVSNWGITYDLIIPTAHSLDIKLAFFPKTTTLI